MRSNNESDDEYDPLEVVVAPSRNGNNAATLSATARSLTTLCEERSEGSVKSAVVVGDQTHLVALNVAPLPVASTLTGSSVEGHEPPPDSEGTSGIGSSSGVAPASGGIRLHGIKGRVRSICLSPTGSILCAGGEDGQLCMWDFQRPPESRRVEPTRVLTPFVNRIAGYQSIISVHSSIDGAFFVVCQEGDRPALVAHGGAQLGYCAMGERGLMDVVRCKGHRAPVTSSAPSATEAKKFFTAGQDGTARMWDSETFTFSSQYAVKHGSGQLDDNYVVESVCGLSAAVGGGQCFVTGGQDGRVQLWDARVKYRPGGAMAFWSAFDVGPSGGPGSSMMMMSDEYHIGGLTELLDGPPMLAARVGDGVHIVDLRSTTSSVSGSRLSSMASGVRKSAAAPVRTEKLGWVPSLSFATDTTPIVRGTGPRSLLTGTSRTGFRHVVGGHVVTLLAAGETQITDGVVDSWAAAKPDEDILCVAVDYTGGAVFAGLSSGDVVVRPRSLTPGSNGSCSFFHWWDSRPTPPHRQHTASGSSGSVTVGGPPSTSRQIGQKSFRMDEDLLF